MKVWVKGRIIEVDRIVVSAMELERAIRDLPKGSTILFDEALQRERCAGCGQFIGAEDVAEVVHPEPEARAPDGSPELLCAACLVPREPWD